MGMIMKDGIPYGGIYPIDDAPTQGSNNAVKSGGVFSALSNKVDKVAGKGLSTNDYDNTEKGKVAANTSAIEAMVNVNGCCNICINTEGDAVVYGTTFTKNSDKSFTVNRPNPQPNMWAVYTIGVGVINKGSYVMTAGVDESLQSKVYLEVMDDNNNSIAHTASGDTTFTLNSDTHVKIHIACYPDVVLTNIIVKPMIYDARLNPTGYVPYAMTNKQLTERVEIITVTGTTQPNGAFPVEGMSMSNVGIPIGFRTIDNGGHSEISGYFITSGLANWYLMVKDVNGQAIGNATLTLKIAYIPTKYI